MELPDRLERVGVVGAAGKMGSGITLLLSQLMAERKLRPESQGRGYRLVAMDVNDAGLDGLRSYLASQLLRNAERNAVALRKLYTERQDLVENAEIIRAFVDDALDLVRFTTDLGGLGGCHMVFEAIAEEIDLKVGVYRKLNELCGPETWFFTNTSSIPISLLNQEAGLGGRIIGYHFYNPPAVQRLLELIAPHGTRPELIEAARTLAAELKKKVIPANDVAGFIGNGHFIRDGLHGIFEMERLAKEHGFAQAVYMVNRVSQDWLVRPMGIFQLIDYVGIDVFQSILGIMNRFIDGEDLHSELIDALLRKGVRGGQNPDGTQKPGFFRYAQGRPEAVYNLESGAYVACEPAFTETLDRALGRLPEGYMPWKALVKDPSRDEKLQMHFDRLARDTSLGAKLALRHLERSKEIGRQLVSSGVAASPEDVNGVLLNGFFHLYGPINEFV